MSLLDAVVVPTGAAGAGLSASGLSGAFYGTVFIWKPSGVGFTLYPPERCSPSGRSTVRGVVANSTRRFTTKLPLALAALLSATAALAQTSPETIALPGGYQPEGIVANDEGALYVGSLADGAIYRADAATGEGDILVAGEEGRITVGLAYDPRTGYLYAAGGATGAAHVFDTAAGTLEASYTLTGGGTFVNDAIVSGDSVYFTDSNREVLYRLALGEGGGLPDADTAVSELPLTGAFSAEPDAFNANGVEAADDGTLIIVKSVSGELFTVGP